jgi:hypothetical protein
MKPKGLAKTLLGTSALTAAIAVSFVAPSASAISDTWTGTTDTTWATSTNWLGGNVPGTGDTATFNDAGNGNTTIDLGTGVTLGALLFDTSNAAAYTIGSGGAGSQTLTLGTVGNAITMNPTVANNELINANLALATNGTYTVTNNSTSNLLTLAGGISASTAGTKILSVTGSGNTAISGAITAGSGAMNLSKFGTGTLTLSGGGALGAGGITNGNSTTLSAVLLGEFLQRRPCRPRSDRPRETQRHRRPQTAARLRPRHPSFLPRFRRVLRENLHRPRLRRRLVRRSAFNPPAFLRRARTPCRRRRGTDRQP